MTVRLTGLTWDHPRGYLVLNALAGTLEPDVSVRWRRQPLEGFESRPLRTLAGDFDLLVVDHPGLGEAVRDGALLPLDELFGGQELAAWRTGSVGASYDSYVLDGRPWALPLDAAAQLAGLASIRSGRATATKAAGTAALEIMSDLLAHADRALSQRNPIGVLDAMAADGGPAYCPLVYGYVTYQRPLGGEPGSSRLAAFDAPAGPGGIGSVLGGTGVAITRSAVELGAAAALIRTLLSDEVQIGRYAELGGQSSARQAWQHSGADAAGGGFYRATLATVEQAWVRPRFAGYPEFQTAASATVREGLLAGQPPARVVRRVNELYAAARRSKSTVE